MNKLMRTQPINITSPKIRKVVSFKDMVVINSSPQTPEQLEKITSIEQKQKTELINHIFTKFTFHNDNSIEENKIMSSESPIKQSSPNCIMYSHCYPFTDRRNMCKKEESLEVKNIVKLLKFRNDENDDSKSNLDKNNSKESLFNPLNSGRRCTNIRSYADKKPTKKSNEPVIILNLNEQLKKMGKSQEEESIADMIHASKMQIEKTIKEIKDLDKDTGNIDLMSSELKKRINEDKKKAEGISKEYKEIKKEYWKVKKEIEMYKKKKDAIKNSIVEMINRRLKSKALQKKTLSTENRKV